jgi:hypothetical protein
VFICGSLSKIRIFARGLFPNPMFISVFIYTPPTVGARYIVPSPVVYATENRYIYKGAGCCKIRGYVR